MLILLISVLMCFFSLLIDMVNVFSILFILRMIVFDRKCDMGF